MRDKKRILPQMFDVRPVKRSGDLDMERIRRIGKVVSIPELTNINDASKNDAFLPAISGDAGAYSGELRGDSLNLTRESAGAVSGKDRLYINEYLNRENPQRLAGRKSEYQADGNGRRETGLKQAKGSYEPGYEFLADGRKTDLLSIYRKQGKSRPEHFGGNGERDHRRAGRFHPAEKSDRVKDRPDPARNAVRKNIFDRESGPYGSVFSDKEEISRIWDRPRSDFASRKPEFLKKLGSGLLRSLGSIEIKKPVFFLGKLSFVALAVFGILRGGQFAAGFKQKSLIGAQEAMADLASAKNSLKSREWAKSQDQFSEANAKLEGISNELGVMGSALADLTKYLPYISKISSGTHLLEAGKDVSRMGVIISDVLSLADQKMSGESSEQVSYLDLFKNNEDKFKNLSDLLKDAEENLGDVNIDDIPEDKKVEVLQMKERLPEISDAMDEFLKEQKILIDILGGNGPRKYLFLFQNNQEMRATGGFIGSYGILDIFDGRVRNFKIDGIFNPDGQLKERIVPPEPIQKISVNWSLHDSNWFPDFPKSAEEAISFYEKTGGPTVDGVITMTPSVMQKLLEVTGPIGMPEYGVTVDKDNFIQEIQYEVEVDYDKELNQPKKILADLAPLIFDKIFNAKNSSDMMKTMDVLLESLNEKHILIYSKNLDVEKLLSDNGWTGEVLDTQKDYVSVINTNINGFKTDGVVDENILHKAQISPDGSIVDTLTITRKHNGGDTPYEWWNKVNSDYMRVYVPKGSRLLSVTGQTREFDEPPLDYVALGYKHDAQLDMEKQSETIDQDSGTRIYEDSGKTVFANWVYVSPKESVTIEYKYLLPFKIETSSQKPADTYSLLAQKQSGSPGSAFSSEVVYPGVWDPIWKYPDSGLEVPDDLPEGNSGFKMDADLKTDKFVGVAFTK